MLNRESAYETVNTESKEGLLSDEDEKVLSSETPNCPRIALKKRQAWPYVSLALNSLLLPTLLAISFRLYTARSPLPPYPSTLYSPAQHLIQYKTVTFVDGLRDFENDDPRRSIYLGPPTEDSDMAWNELYNVGGISQISAEEATKLGQDTASVRHSSEFKRSRHCLGARDTDR